MKHILFRPRVTSKIFENFRRKEGPLKITGKVLGLFERKAVWP